MRRLILCTTLTFGCGSGDASGPAAPGATDGPTDGITGGGSGGSTGPGPGAATEKLDVGGGTTMGSGSAETGAQACRKIDVILAVDNSGSMQEEIADLRGPVFNSLPDQLLAVGEGIDDFHLAVVDACPTPPNYHDTGKAGACSFSTGANWMLSSSPDLTTEFECVSDLSKTGYQGMPDGCMDADGLMDDDEQPALTAAESLAPPLQAGANAGFLRDDALLFVVAITDEDEELLGTEVDEVVQRYVDAKGGIENVVFLGIGGDALCNGPYGTAIPATNLKAITNVFDSANRGLFWDLCQGDLEGAFATVIDALDAACFEFVPPG